MAQGSTRQPKKRAAAPPEKTDSLNFKVSPDFKKEFKVYAVSRGISMVDLLREGFALSKKQRSQ